MLTNALETEDKQDSKKAGYRNPVPCPTSLCTRPRLSSVFSCGRHILIPMHHTIPHIHTSALETESPLMFTCKYHQP